MICKICAGEVEKTNFPYKILGKIDAHIFMCNKCGFQFFNADWLEMAYERSIARLDTGSVRRSIGNALKLNLVFPLFKLNNLKVVDVGGGVGLMARLLRDLGFDATSIDEYQDNILCNGFEDTENKQCICTAFEVAEHLSEPVEFFNNLLRKFNPTLIIFSTEILKSERGFDWWYYTPSTGQHVAFYTTKALEKLAEKLELNLTSIGSFHFLSKEPLTIFMKIKINFILKSKVSLLSMVKYLFAAWTNVQKDYERVLK